MTNPDYYQSEVNASLVFHLLKLGFKRKMHHAVGFYSSSFLGSKGIPSNLVTDSSRNFHQFAGFKFFV